MSRPEDFCIGCINDEYPEGLAANVKELETDRDRLKAVNAELLAALEPLAELAYVFDKRRGNSPFAGSDEIYHWSITDGEFSLTVEMLRKCRSAIASAKSQETDK